MRALRPRYEGSKAMIGGFEAKIGSSKAKIGGSKAMIGGSKVNFLGLLGHDFRSGGSGNSHPVTKA